MPRLLVTGANGQLGRELLKRGPDLGLVMLGRTRADLDIGDPDAVLRVVADAGVDVVVNAAAYTAVDLAEQDRDRAFAVNAAGPLHLAQACAANGLPLLHVSTDYVFDGTKSGAYREDDPVAPINVYGASKEAGERAVRDALPAHVILRTSWVYSAHGRNFVLTMRQLAAERDTLNVVADQHGSPTSAADLADAILKVASRLAGGATGYGTFHYTGAGVTTWHGFAGAVMDRCLPPGRPSPRLVPISTADFPRPAARPANSALDCRLIEQVWGIRPRPWREALADVCRELGAGG